MSSALSESSPTLRVADADAAYAETLSSLLNRGDLITSGKSLSVGSELSSHEILNFEMVLENPRDKLIFNKARRINLPAAVARFLWMMAGSDRLADIAFYEPKVSFFSDDGISIPGSNYGHRILRSRPGLNQLQAVIDRLREDPQSRRAAISIYHPEDAVRTSRDIPCAFGVFYNVRRERLQATTLMRSNNAFILLPYNIFEFALLAEVVAAELEVPLGSLTHIAISMHLYERDVENAKKVIAEFEAATRPADSIPKIAPGSKPLEQIRRLVILEAELRHASEGLSGSNIEEWIVKGEEKLDQYWRQYYYLLLLYVVSRKSGYLGTHASAKAVALEALESVIEEPWKSYLPLGSFRSEAKQLVSVEDIFDRPLADGASAKIIPFHRTVIHHELRNRAEEYERTAGGEINWREFAALEDHFADQVAARESEGISQELFSRALEVIRGGGHKLR